MGAPKQKWTAEEEAALKAGVRKHGPGKWRTILTDSEFSDVLRLRSNVDLKDKWRNINVMANGLGSRSKARLAIKKSQSASKHGSNSMTLVTVPQIEDAKPLSVSSGPLRTSGHKESIARLDKLILEAITKLGDPSGSDKAEIAAYIEEQYWSPPNFKTVLSAKLKHMAETGKLTKAKRKYKISPSGLISGVKRTPILLEGKHDSSRTEKNENNVLSKPLIDAELSKMRSMTAQEAATAAARAVAEAEAAIAEAEAAAREAETAEAEAEAADIFAKAAMKALQCRTNNIWADM